MTYEEMTLDNLASGALHELFAIELAKVVENINDPNTSGKTTREITIKICFAPHKTRNGADVSVSCKSKLSPSLEAFGEVFLTLQQGKLVAVTRNVDQGSLFEETPPDAPPETQDTALKIVNH